MISKMKKITLLIYHREYEDFLNEVRSVGTFHIIQKQVGELPDFLHNAIQKNNTYRNTLAEMSSIIGKEDMKNLKTNSIYSAEEILSLYEEFKKSLQDKRSELSNVERRIQAMSEWGDFSWETIQKLRESGYHVGFYVCAAKDFNKEEWGSADIVVIKEKNNSVYFFAISNEPLHIPIEQAKLPKKSLSELLQQKQLLEAEIEAVEAEMKEFSLNNYFALENYELINQNEINFKKAKLNGEDKAEGSVVLLEGWVPEEDEEELVKHLENTGVYYKIEKAKKEDNAPIKLKNNMFNRMYETITKMYGMPEYAEFDPTPLVAPFFTLFFGLCLADAGYGLILVLIGFLLKRKMSKSLSGMFNLVITLGIATTVIGAILGTFFGFDLFQQEFLPEGYRNIMLTGKFKDTNYDTTMIVALIVGVIHITIAMFVKALGTTMRYSFKSSISEWSWLLLILGAIIIGTLQVVNFITSETSYWALIIVGGISAIGIYLLNNLKRNPLVNIAFGLLDTYNVATGLLGDILSYIRLYALGLAGSMLGAVFNKLGFMVNDAAGGGLSGWILCGLILIFGHSLNIAMSCISAFVHPLRLVFVEYFKNSNYSGTGEAYSPFKILKK